MKLETGAGELASALKLMRGIIEGRTTIPVLSMVAMENGKITGTDLDLDLTVTLPGNRGQQNPADEWDAWCEARGAMPCPPLFRPDMDRLARRYRNSGIDGKLPPVPALQPGASS